MIKSTLRRSIRRAQARDLIGRNVIDLIDLPAGKARQAVPGHDRGAGGRRSQGGRGRLDRYTRVVKASNGRYGATHAATEAGDARLRHPAAPEGDRSPKSAATCSRRPAAHAGPNSASTATATPTSVSPPLFVVAITLGLRPGELRKLTWDLVDLNRGVVHVWRSASKSGDTKTPQSKRSLVLPKRAISALTTHKQLQDREREAAGRSWHENNLVFCHEDGSMYSADALNWRFGKMTRRAGIGHWHAHEGRHTAVSIMSSNGVPIQDISDTVGHKSTHVTETVYRHVIRPTIRGGATVMDDVFGDPDDEVGELKNSPER